MGVEWLNRAHKTFSRSVAKARSHVLTPRLSAPTIDDVDRCFRVRMEPDRSLEPGTSILLRAAEDRVALLDGDEHVIGQTEELPGWLSKLVNGQAEGFAYGIVDGFNPLACTADVRLHTGAGK